MVYRITLLLIGLVLCTACQCWRHECKDGVADVEEWRNSFVAGISLETNREEFAMIASEVRSADVVEVETGCSKAYRRCLMYGENQYFALVLYAQARTSVSPNRKRINRMLWQMASQMRESGSDYCVRIPNSVAQAVIENAESPQEVLEILDRAHSEKGRRWLVDILKCELNDTVPRVLDILARYDDRREWRTYIIDMCNSKVAGRVEWWIKYLDANDAELAKELSRRVTDASFYVGRDMHDKVAIFDGLLHSHQSAHRRFAIEMAANGRGEERLAALRALAYVPEVLGEFPGVGQGIIRGRSEAGDMDVERVRKSWEKWMRDVSDK